MAASQQSKKFVQAIAKSLEAVPAAGTAGGTYMQDQGSTETIKVSGAAVEFIAAQLDVAVALIEDAGKKGPQSKAMLYSLLAQKGLAFGDFIPEDSVQCMSALVSLGLSLGRLAATAPTGVAALWPAALLLSDVYATYVDCKSPFNKATSAGMNSLSRFMHNIETEIYRAYRLTPNR